MVITGSALFIEPGTMDAVLEKLRRFHEVTFHVHSESGTELVVNLEADDTTDLESLCSRLKEEIHQIVDITHIYVNFEDEIERMQAGPAR